MHVPSEFYSLEYTSKVGRRPAFLMDLFSPVTFEMPVKVHLGSHAVRTRLFIKLKRIA